MGEAEEEALAEKFVAHPPVEREDSQTPERACMMAPYFTEQGVRETGTRNHRP